MKTFSLFIALFISFKCYAKERRPRFHCNDIVIERCIEWRPFAKADIVKTPKGPGSFDLFEYKLLYREKIKALHIILDSDGDEVFERENTTYHQMEKSFQTSELTGGIKDLEGQVNRFISELEFNKCRN